LDNDVKAVVFDMYNTLLFMQHKSVPSPWVEVFGMVAANRDKEFDMAKAVMFTLTHELTAVECVKCAVWEQVPQYDNEELDKVIATCEFSSRVSKDAASVKLYADTYDTLVELRNAGYKLGLVSNLAVPYCQALDICGIRHFFDAVVFSCMEGVAKGCPGDPRIYELAAARLAVELKDCVFVGDSVQSDYKEAIASGMRAAHLDRNAREETLTLRKRPTISTLTQLKPLARSPELDIM